MAELERFANDLWVVDGPYVHAVGLTFPTRMMLAKLGDGSLWVNSPIPLSLEDLDQVLALGPVRYLVAPTKMHVWRLKSWHALFPQAELWRPPQIPRKFRKLSFAGTLGDVPPAAWADDLDQLVFRGNCFVDEVFFLHRRSGTVILADFIQNHRPLKGRPLLNLLLKLGGVAFPHGGVPRDIRWSFFNRKTARESLEKLLGWDFDKLMIGHGVCIRSDAKAFVKRAFRWLE